jgi:hypothetical protein
MGFYESLQRSQPSIDRITDTIKQVRAQKEREDRMRQLESLFQPQSVTQLTPQTMQNVSGIAQDKETPVSPRIFPPSQGGSPVTAFPGGSGVATPQTETVQRIPSVMERADQVGPFLFPDDPEGLIKFRMRVEDARKKANAPIRGREGDMFYSPEGKLLFGNPKPKTPKVQKYSPGQSGYDESGNLLHKEPPVTTETPKEVRTREHADQSDAQKVKDVFNLADSSYKQISKTYGDETLNTWVKDIQSEEPDIVNLSKDANANETMIAALIGNVTDPKARAKVTIVAQYLSAQAKRDASRRNLQDRGYDVDDSGGLIKKGAVAKTTKKTISGF